MKLRVIEHPTASPEQSAAIALLLVRYPGLKFEVGKEPGEVVAKVPLQYRVWCDVTKAGWLAEMDKRVERFRADCASGLKMTERAE